MKRSIASRLSGLYTVLLGVTVLVVFIASSIALVLQLSGYARDILIAKHEEARILADQYRADGMTLPQSAAQIADALSGVGLRVAVYDESGAFLAGDKDVHPRFLARAVRERRAHGSIAGPAFNGRFPPPFDRNRPPVPPSQFFGLTEIAGGFVAFSSTPYLVFIALVPYWRAVLIIAAIAIADLVFRRASLRQPRAAADQRRYGITARARAAETSRSAASSRPAATRSRR